MTHRGRPAATRSTSALARSLAIAATACALAAAPAAAYVLHPAASVAVTVKITTHPAPATAGSTAKFAWKTTGTGVKTTCRLDSGAYASCSRTRSYTQLKDGAHTFTIRAKSGATTRTATSKWRVDTLAPTAPTVTGGTGTWTTATVTLAAAGATDTGGSGIASYQHRSSANAGVSWGAAAAGATAQVTADGTTWVQFRALDKAGNASAWAPATADPAAEAMVDTLPPSLPVLTGGSGTWANVASVIVQPTGTPADAGSGFAGYEYRTSADAGSTWSAPTAGSAATISAEGVTLVEFRSLDALGNASAWTGINGQVQIDRTPPTAPTLTGGSTSWQAGPTVTVSASGSADAGSGVSAYEYETSTNGGSTWSSPTTGPSAAISAQGTTLVRFAAVDGVALASPWTQATVKLDLTAPSAPTVAGGSSSWSTAASATVTASGSTDTGGSGLSGYQYRTSTDGGTTWSAATSGPSDTVSAEANTWVQLRSVDVAGNTSAWTPATQTAGATVKLDRTAPTTPIVTGGSAGWSNTSITVSATSIDAGSGGVTYQHKTSVDNGSTWSTPASGGTVVVSGAGKTLVQFQATDAVGLTSAWSGVTAGGTAQLDLSAPSNPASVTGGSASWQLTAPVTITAAGATDSGGSGLAGYQYRTSTDGGTTWSAALPAPAAISGDGTTIVQMRAVDGAGNTSAAWTPASPGAGNTVKIDTTPPTAPTLSGGTGWSTAASVLVSASGSTDTPGSGVSGYQHETSADGGATWSAATAGASVSVSAEGTTLVRFQALDVAGHASAWAQTSVQLDRTAPSAPTVAGGSLVWANAASRTVTASASTDAGSGLAGYQHRTSTDGGATWSAPVAGSSLNVPAEGETLVEYQSIDNVGNVSAWTPVPTVTGGTVRLDRTAPTTPTATGGSSGWLNAASLPISAAGATDTGGSGVASYEYRTSTNGGANWSPATAGATVNVTAQGTTLVEFRAIDGVGLMSPWSAISAGGTANLDQTAPTVPTITGGSNSYQNIASVTLTAAGSTDTGGSGLEGYQYRSEFDLSNVWSGAADGFQTTVSAEGLTIVQFRSVDNAGNTSAWEPFAAYPGDIVKIDRTAPGVPTVAGGSPTWSAAASVTVTASKADDGASAFASGVTGYQNRTSTNGGATWSAAASGASVPVTAQGTTLVQFRSVDAAGNVSAWTPATPDATNTVMLDRTAPTLPTVSGAPGACTAGPVTLTASSSTDSWSGLDHYESMVNTGSIVAGSSVVISAHGTSTVKFRSVDGVGNASAWVTNSVCIS